MNNYKLYQAIGESIAEAERVLQLYPPEARLDALNHALVYKANCNTPVDRLHWLLAQGADVNFRFVDDGNERSALHTAVECAEVGDIPVVEILLEAGLDKTLFPDAVFDCVDGRVLIGGMYYPGDDEPDFQEMLKYLLEKGFAVNWQNEDGNTALHEAVRCYVRSFDWCQGEDLIPILLSHGADVAIRNHKGLTPLDMAMQNGDEKTVALLKAVMS